MPARLAVKGQQYPPEERMPMPFKTPPQISEAAVVSGAAKAVQRWDKVLVGGFLAGAYIAFGGLLAISVSSGLNPNPDHARSFGVSGR